MRLARGKKMNKEFDQIADNFLEPIKTFKGNLSDLAHATQDKQSNGCLEGVNHRSSRFTATAF